MGPLLPDTARQLARQAEAFTQIAVDPDGHVIAVSDRQRADKLRESTSSDDSTDSSSDAGDQERPAPNATMPTGSVAPVGSDDFLTRAIIAMRRPPVVRGQSSKGYRPSGRLTRFVQARDRTCVFPGCRQPAMRTDLDHREPWPRGRTTADNLQCVCRHHHRAKHSNVFTVLADPDGTIIWITRGGWIFRRRPQGY